MRRILVLVVAAMMAITLSFGVLSATADASGNGPWCHKGKVTWGKGHGKHGDPKAYKNKYGKYVCKRY